VGTPRRIDGRNDRCRAPPGRRAAAGYRHSILAEGRVTERDDSVIETARSGSGIDTVYRALDLIVERYSLTDATLVVDVPGFGRQVLHAGRRPLPRDERRLHAAEPGLYLEPPLADAADAAVLADLAVALGALGLRHDARVRGAA